MRRFGLIGRTLTHSFSKKYFEKKFEAEGISDCFYDNFELKNINEFPDLIKNNGDIRGLNITIPYKEEIIQFLTDKNDIVKEIRACNCIKIEKDRLYGFNTDAIAFKKSLEKQLKSNHKKALILGSGGASKAIRFALRSLNIEYQIVSRHKKEDQLGYEDLGNDIFESHHLIINTTPLGMFPNVDQDPSVPYSFITPKHFFFDIIYNPQKTKFLCEGEKKGAQIANGYEMLVLQAEESWKIWNEDLK